MFLNFLKNRDEKNLGTQIGWASKKISGSDSAQISCVKSLGHKDFKFWVSSKSETKKNFFSKGPDLWHFSDFQSLDFLKNIKGSPLWKKKFFLSPILMKFKICNPYGLRILHMKFEPNRRPKKFFQNFREKSKGGTLLCQKIFCHRFCSNFMCEIIRPLEKKFFFVADFDETQNLKSLWPRDFTHEIWAESVTKNFLT